MGLDILELGSLSTFSIDLLSHDCDPPRRSLSHSGMTLNFFLVIPRGPR